MNKFCCTSICGDYELDEFISKVKNFAILNKYSDKITEFYIYYITKIWKNIPNNSKLFFKRNSCILYIDVLDIEKNMKWLKMIIKNLMLADSSIIRSLNYIKNNKIIFSKDWRLYLFFILNINSKIEDDDHVWNEDQVKVWNIYSDLKLSLIAYNKCEVSILYSMNVFRIVNKNIFSNSEYQGNNKIHDNINGWHYIRYYHNKMSGGYYCRFDWDNNIDNWKYKKYYYSDFSKDKNEMELKFLFKLSSKDQNGNYRVLLKNKPTMCGYLMRDIEFNCKNPIHKKKNKLLKYSTYGIEILS